MKGIQPGFAPSKNEVAPSHVRAPRLVAVGGGRGVEGVELGRVELVTELGAHVRTQQAELARGALELARGDEVAVAPLGALGDVGELPVGGGEQGARRRAIWRGDAP